ncbi:MAG: sodium:proton antiporter [Candidatus Moraniibacteriota bacterium]|nr:MAG: sodium:proton antiporter [Candidatus Moranbacteria bacterium]
MSLETVLSFFVLMLISIGTYFVSKRIRAPYTVLLVLVGSLLVPLTHIPLFHFLQAFQLTPELLFYLFLPILIFESAYNMRARDLKQNIRAVSWFSVGSLVISMFFIAVVLFLVLGLIGMEVPFMATLLFGALISATDPVAVLALFKEFGVPRRLAFLFEGESLFNDGTSLAAFLVVLEIILAGFSGVSTVLEGLFTFSTMVFGGIVFGIAMGFLFAKLIGRVEDNEHIEITLTMLVAHLTFILSEVLSHHLVIGGQEIKLSAIIATVMASMVIGNYGRSKLSISTHHFMESFWGYFAFLVNSLVFITMGFLFASLPIELHVFILPMLLTVIVVAVARAVSIYPVAWWLNRSKKEESIPMTWQHLMSWGSLRGALAVVMVLLIPDTLTIPGWQFDFTVKEFITALTIACIYFTLFVKALTIGTLIRRFKLDALTGVEEAGYHQARSYVLAFGQSKIDDFFDKHYMNEETHVKLTREIDRKRKNEQGECEKAIAHSGNDFEEALRVYAIGIEKHFLGLLFQYREVSESVYKRILTKLDVQLERVEVGGNQIQSLDEAFEPDWFEQLASGARRLFLIRQDRETALHEQYMYYRAQEIIARKVVKEFDRLKQHPMFDSPAYDALLDKVLAAYQVFREDASNRKQALFAEHESVLMPFDQSFGSESLRKAYADGLHHLTRKNMLPAKLAILLDEDLAKREF